MQIQEFLRVDHLLRAANAPQMQRWSSPIATRRQFRPDCFKSRRTADQYSVQCRTPAVAPRTTFRPSGGAQIATNSAAGCRLRRGRALPTPYRREDCGRRRCRKLEEGLS